MLPKFDILTDEQIDKIHKNSMKILQEIGVEFSYDPAIEILRNMANGLKVTGFISILSLLKTWSKRRRLNSLFMLEIQSTTWFAAMETPFTCQVTEHHLFMMLMAANGMQPWQTMTTLLNWPVPVKTCI